MNRPELWQPVVGLRLGELAVRMCGLSVALALSHKEDTGFILLVAIVGVAIDLRNPLCLKNFFLAYTFLLFAVGAGVLHLTAVPVIGDAASFALAFLAGYGLSSFRRADRRPVKVARPAVLPSIPSIERAMYAVAVLDLLLLAYQFYRFGVRGYLQGRQLIDAFDTYGKASGSGGAEQIVRFGLTYSAVALVVLYAQACFDSARPIRYRYPIGLLAIMPILLLQRFDAVLGAASILAVYACERRLNATRSANRPSRTRRQLPPISARHGSRHTIVVGALIVVFCSAILIGGLRRGLGASGGGPAPAISTHSLLIEEFYPVQGYADIKTNGALLGHPYGKTIVLPLLFKVVPRAWLPNKPLNSSAYYISKVHPALYALGFGVPPTFYGDALLSFGYVGALMALMLLGFVSARLDVGYTTSKSTTRTAMYLIAFTNYYALFRGAISETLAGIILTLLVYEAAKMLLRSTPEREERPLVDAS